MVRKTLGFVVAVVIFVGLATPDANAGWGSWGSHGSSGGSWGSHGSSGGGSWGSSGGSWGSSGGSWGSSGGSWGSRGSWGSHGSHGFRRVGWRHRHHRRYVYNSSGGSWGSHGSSGGSWGSQGSSGGSWGSQGGSSGGSWDSSGAGVIIQQEQVVPAAPPADEVMDTDSARNDRGVLTVSVPKGATITVNGNATKSTGALRRYVSKGLNRGYNYRYEVTAVVDVDGKPVERTQVATLRAGRTAHLDFDFTQAQSVETRLTLNVPDDAEVFLSGVKTKSTGPVRNFITSKITEGEKWSDYHVVVTVERDGQKLSKEQDVSLSGGDNLELSFNFDQTELASAR